MRDMRVFYATNRHSKPNIVCFLSATLRPPVGIKWRFNGTVLWISRTVLLEPSNPLTNLILWRYQLAKPKTYGKREMAISSRTKILLWPLGIRFRSDLMLHQYRVKASLVQPLLDWLFSSFASLQNSTYGCK
jgi:hypothetical protein